MFAHLNPHRFDFGDISAPYPPFVQQLIMQSMQPMWRAVFERFLGKVLQDNTFKCYMHVAAQSICITTDACRPQMDVYCICGRCGAERSVQRRWTLGTMAEVRQWPTFNYASANLFLTKKQRKELAKERRKGKAVRGTCSTPGVLALLAPSWCIKEILLLV